MKKQIVKKKIKRKSVCFRLNTEIVKKFTKFCKVNEYKVCDVLESLMTGFGQCK